MVVLAILSIGGAAAPAAAELVGPVSGTVRSAGAPVANAWVTLMPVTPTGDWAGKPVQTTTDRDGRYQFSDVSAFQVKVQVRAPSFSGLATTYWPDAYSFATAGTLLVASSGSTADVDLPVGGSISGRVVDADTGAPILGARVLAHVDAPPGWEQVGSAGPSPGPGLFVIDGLPPAPVALQARPPVGSNHLGQWHDGAGFYGEAEPVQPGTTGLIIGLREGGQVGGVVRDDQGVAVPGAAVTIVGCAALCPMAAVTDDSGAYRVTGVPPGPGLRAYAEATEAGLLSRWYTDRGQRRDSFDLTRGQVRNDLDFALTAGAVAIGRVLDGQTGAPIPGVTVDLVDVDNPLNSYLSRGVDARGAGAALGPRDQPGSAADPSQAPSVAGSGPARPRPGQASEFVIGPVPPGEYWLIVYPGSENGDYLPVEVVARTGLDGAGLIDLGRGERAEFTLSLARQRTPAVSAVGVGGSSARADGPARGDLEDAPPDPGASAGWPGLFAGFLGADGAGLLGLGA
jgi:hypothetical protein